MVNTSETFNYRKPQTFYMWDIQIPSVCHCVQCHKQLLRTLGQNTLHPNMLNTNLNTVPQSFWYFHALSSILLYKLPYNLFYLHQ